VPRRGVVCLWRRHEGSELRRAPAPGHCHQASLQAQFWELAGVRRSVCLCLCPSLTVGSVISLLYIAKALFSSKKFCKIFQILRHIESLDACMEY